MKTMHIKSTYISKKEATQEFDATNAPNRTSKTNLEIASDDRISQNPEKSTASAKKSSTDRKALSDEDFNLDDYTIEELLKFNSEQFEQAYGL